MIIVDDEIRATNSANNVLYQVSGSVTRRNEHPDLRWSAPLPTLAVWATTYEEALVTYKAHINDMLIAAIKNQVARDEMTIHAYAKEVGPTAPYQYGDYCEVLVMNDDLTETWRRCVVYSAEKHRSGKRWMIQVSHGWAGTNAFLSRAWCDDAGIGDVIRPVEQPTEVTFPLQVVPA